MKTANVADLRNRFADVSRWISAGESVMVMKRGTAFAVLSPVQKSIPVPPGLDRMSRLRKIFPDGPVTGKTEDVLDYDRGNT